MAIPSRPSHGPLDIKICSTSDQIWLGLQARQVSPLQSLSMWRLISLFTTKKKLYKCEWLLTIHSAIKRKKSWYVGHMPWPCGPVRRYLGLNVGQTHSRNHTYTKTWPITYMWIIVDPHCMLIETCVSYSHHRVPTLWFLPFGFGTSWHPCEPHTFCRFDNSSIYGPHINWWPAYVTWLAYTDLDLLTITITRSPSQVSDMQQMAHSLRFRNPDPLVEWDGQTLPLRPPIDNLNRSKWMLFPPVIYYSDILQKFKKVIHHRTFHS